MKLLTFAIMAGLFCAGCSGKTQPMPVVDHVNIKQFMGDWYVIAYTPTFIDKNAYNAVESYRLNDDGTIATTYTFNNGTPDGPQKTYKPKGFVTDHPSNAIWGMQFVWPIKADYRIIYLSDDGQHTIIGRKQRDYVWIMARKPQVDAETYQRLKDYALSVGYRPEQLKLMPQTDSK